jgi:hypothetical protein
MREEYVREALLEVDELRTCWMNCEERQLKNRILGPCLDAPACSTPSGLCTPSIAI